MPVKIASLLANEPEPQLKELAPPVAVLEEDSDPGLRRRRARGAAALGGAGRPADACGGCGPAPPTRPPAAAAAAHEIALEKLDRLAQLRLRLENADHRQFYFSSPR